MGNEFSDNRRKDVTKFVARQWNHERAGPAKLDGNTLHRRASFPVWRVMVYR